MLDKLRPTEQGNWDKSSKPTERSRDPQDSYRKVEKDKHRPPTKDEQEKGVEEKKEFRSVFDISKQNKPKNAPPVAAKSFTPKETKDTPKKSSREAANKPSGEVKQEPHSEIATGDEPIAEQEEFPPVLDHEEGQAPSDQMAKSGAKPQVKPQVKPQQPQQPQQSPETLVAQQSAPAKPMKPVEKTPEDKAESKTTKTEKNKGESKTSSTESPEKGASGSIFTPIQGVSLGSEKAQGAQETSRSSTLGNIASQIVDQIQVMRKDDLTSTIITLKNPPVLDGATITLTTSDNAKREFSISFANLSTEGKMLLDGHVNSLKETLDQKGIIVNSLTTSTQPEKIITADAGQAAQDQREQKQEQQQRRQQFKEPEEEEET